MGGCIGIHSTDNETVSVSSASISRPTTGAGEWAYLWLQYFPTAQALQDKLTYTYIVSQSLFFLIIRRRPNGSITQKSPIVQWDNTLAFRCAIDRGAAAFETWWILGYCAGVRWSQRNLGCAAGSHKCGGRVKFWNGAGNTRRSEYLGAQWVCLHKNSIP